jgi:hypothetical protein
MSFLIHEIRGTLYFPDVSQKKMFPNDRIDFMDKHASSSLKKQKDGDEPSFRYSILATTV